MYYVRAKILQKVVKMKKIAIKKRHIRCILLLTCILCLVVRFYTVAYADENDYSVTLSMPDNDEGSVSSTIQILIVLTVLSLAPAIIILLTSFTRIIVVLHFTRSALGTQTTPPNQVLIGLALFLTLFIMSPVFLEVNSKAIKPLNEGKISYEEAFENLLWIQRAAVHWIYNQYDHGLHSIQQHLKFRTFLYLGHCKCHLFYRSRNYFIDYWFCHQK